MTQLLPRYELILAEAARLREKYQAARPEQFNLFSVLRRPGDEVHLHSRFLAALLDHRKGPSGRQHNLADFMTSVINLDGGLADDAQVLREFRNVDILVRDKKRAVVVENKIWAEDQHRQLERYYREMRDQGYSAEQISLVYLSLDGREPTDESLGSLKRASVQLVSYSDLLPWLERCGERAHEEPALRESVSQYRRLVAQLTGNDHNGEHMAEIQKLILKEDNLQLADDLARGLLHAKVQLLRTLWTELETDLSQVLCAARKDNSLSDTSQGQIEKYLAHERGSLYWGLYYRCGDNAHLGVELGYGFFYGVRCSPEHTAERKAIRTALGGAGLEWEWWPWVRAADELGLRDRIDGFVQLSDDDFRANYVKAITDEVQVLFGKLRSAGLVSG